LPWIKRGKCLRRSTDWSGACTALVDVVAGDFNKDGQTDYVIAEFGTHSGKLSPHFCQPDRTLRETVLLEEAGAISLAVTRDDLWVLVAHADERFLRLKDFGAGTPVAETILRFPPSYGSNDLQVLDFNGDGRMDLLYAAGGNADITPIFKPYHGIYLFTGQTDGSFQQEMFFHLDGATAALAEDFDQDGDQDIAAIAYYGNIDQGLDQARVAYLQNNDGVFEAKSVDSLGRIGRFIAISSGDIDGDGDMDVALANMSFGPCGPLKVSPDLQGQWLKGPRFVLLRNQLR
jgi:hypothetical protein